MGEVHLPSRLAVLWATLNHGSLQGILYGSIEDSKIYVQGFVECSDFHDETFGMCVGHIAELKQQVLGWFKTGEEKVGNQLAATYFERVVCAMVEHQRGKSTDEAIVLLANSKIIGLSCRQEIRKMDGQAWRNVIEVVGCECLTSNEARKLLTAAKKRKMEESDTVLEYRPKMSDNIPKMVIDMMLPGTRYIFEEHQQRGRRTKGELGSVVESLNGSVDVLEAAALSALEECEQLVATYAQRAELHADLICRRNGLSN